MLTIFFYLSALLLPAGLVADTEEMPELELLEFLGEWQSDGNDWFDPLQMQELASLDNQLQPVEVKGDE